MRTFMLGAGFSKPAGLPLTEELTQLVFDRLREQYSGTDPREWTRWIQTADALAGWFAKGDASSPFSISIEELF